MLRYYRKTLESVLKPPDVQGEYLLIQNQYWLIDRNNNVFFMDSYPICGVRKQTVEFYISNLKLPFRRYSMFPYLKHLKKAWVKQPVGYSVRREDVV